jgi:chromosome segregation ATPase
MASYNEDLVELNKLVAFLERGENRFAGLKDLLSRAAKAENEVARLTKQAIDLQNEVNKAQKALADTITSADKTRKELEAAISKRSKEADDKHSAEVATQQAELSKIRQQVDAARSEHFKLSGKYSDDINLLRNTKEALEQEVNALSTKLAELRAQASALAGVK